MLIGTVVLREVVSLQDLQWERKRGERGKFWSKAWDATYIQKSIGETTNIWLRIYSCANQNARNENWSKKGKGMYQKGNKDENRKVDDVVRALNSCRSGVIESSSRNVKCQGWLRDRSVIKVLYWQNITWPPNKCRAHLNDAVQPYHLADQSIELDVD